MFQRFFEGSFCIVKFIDCSRTTRC